MAVTTVAAAERKARAKNQNHSSKKILSLIMFRLSTHIAWSTLRFPVKAPEGNWHLKKPRMHP